MLVRYLSDLRLRMREIVLMLEIHMIDRCRVGRMNVRHYIITKSMVHAAFCRVNHGRPHFATMHPFSPFIIMVILLTNYDDESKLVLIN